MLIVLFDVQSELLGMLATSEYAYGIYAAESRHC